MIKLLLLSLLIPSRLMAARAIMEGTPASGNTVYVSTQNARLIVGATHYTGVIPNVSLSVSSNLVVGANKCVIYSSGSLACLSIGNASTASSFATAPTPCSVGSYTRGIDASGNSLSCTVAATGDVTAAGNNILTGQNRFSAANTFGVVYITGVSTVGPQGFTNVVNTSGTISNVPFKVASANPAATSSSFTIAGLEADKQYRLVGSLATTIAGFAYMRFNQDFSATVYDWTYQGANSNGGAAVINGDNSDPMCRLHEASMAASANPRAFITCDIYTGADYGWAMCDTVVEDGNPFIEKTHSSCRYNVGTPTSVQLAVTGAGLISGKFYLTELK